MFNKEVWEVASFVVTVIGLPVAIVIFLYQARRERANEEEQEYQLLNDAYNDFLRVDDPNLPGTMTVTVEIKKAVVGTELRITQEGVPDVIPADACYLGWGESLDLLRLLVEPEIPDQG